MLRIVFMGTPHFAVPTLAGIIGGGHEVAAVYTQPPRPAGRGMDARPSPVHALAAASHIPVLTPKAFTDREAREAFRAHAADVAVVAAYGLLLPEAVLEAPRYGCLNLHGSALPRWRGAAPIQRAIMAGDGATAATIMRMDKGLDTGPVCLAEPIAIGPDTTAGELHDSMAIVGAQLMLRALAALERGGLDCQPQPGVGVSYARKIGKAEARIDFTRPAREVHDRIRGLSPAPGAWLEAPCEGGSERIKVLRSSLADASGAPGTVLDGAMTVACGAGAIRLEHVQRAGKRPMPAAELLRGLAIPAGTRLR